MPQIIDRSAEPIRQIRTIAALPAHWANLRVVPREPAGDAVGDKYEFPRVQRTLEQICERVCPEKTECLYSNWQDHSLAIGNCNEAWPL